MECLLEMERRAWAGRALVLMLGKSRQSNLGIVRQHFCMLAVGVGASGSGRDVLQRPDLRLCTPDPETCSSNIWDKGVG